MTLHDNQSSLDAPFITVVIPVYNAAKYLRQACESALMQPETAEVILVEDGSTDNSLKVCEELVCEYPAVRLLRHKGGRNRGVSCSRNLGIKFAVCEWIAFLDADDFFLENRFAYFKEVLRTHPDAEAVCEAVGVYFEDERAKVTWGHKRSLATLKKRFNPEQLFYEQGPVGNGGRCGTRGWTVKKGALERCGMFPSQLRVHEDTALFVKLSGGATVYPGELETPVAMRRVHGGPSLTVLLRKKSHLNQLRARIVFWKDVCIWARRKRPADFDLIAKRFIDEVEMMCVNREAVWYKIYKTELVNILAIPLWYPRVLLCARYRERLVAKIVQGTQALAKSVQRRLSSAW